MKAIKKNIYIILSLVIGMFVFSTCTLQEDIYLTRDGGGTLSTNFEVEDFYVEFLGNYVDIDAGLKDIQTELAKNKNVTDVSIVEKSNGIYSGQFSFKNIENVFSDGEKQAGDSNIFALKKQGDTRIVEICLNRENYQKLENSIPLLNDPLISSFGPTYNQGVSSQEYIEMVDNIFLEQDLPAGEPKASFRQSVVVVNVKVEGKILKHRGGFKKGPNHIQYRIPLVNILILDQEYKFSIQYQ